MHGKTIKIKISPTGVASVDLNGFHGEGCGDVVKSFGGDDACLHEETKAEFYESVEVERQEELL